MTLAEFMAMLASCDGIIVAPSDHARRLADALRAMTAEDWARFIEYMNDVPQQETH